MQIERIPANTPEYDELQQYDFFFIGRGDVGQGMQRANDIWYFALKEFLGDSISNPNSLVASDPKLLNVPLLREAVTGIIARDSLDLNEDVRTAYVIHPPELKAIVVKTLSKLPLAADGNRRLLSVSIGNEVWACPVESYPLEIPTHHSKIASWLMLLLSNPDDPEVVLSLPDSGFWAESEIRPMPQDARKIEFQAVEAIKTDLLGQGLEVNPDHEPNGFGTFPDFEASIGSTKWSIEVTRVLGDIPNERTIKLDGRNIKAMKARAVRSSPIDAKEIDAALQKALKDKGARASKCKLGSKYCLVLMNVANLDIGKDSQVWAGKDLSAFDAVVMIHCRAGADLTLEYIKGTLSS